MQHPIIIVLATRNQGKTEEIKTLLDQFNIDIKNLDDFGPIPPIVEDGETFEENAYKKASLTARYLGLPALADDSGLVVEALNGAPGVHSARYAGQQATDSQRYRKLLQELGDSDHRSAKFVCVLSLAVPAGPALTYEASCEGVITQEPVGTGGFGYDPVFYYPPLNQTFAQLTRQEKNKVSHRGKALHEFCMEFEKVVVWLQRHLASSAPAGCMGSNG
jgi:XTP/dITP diphosphohydrolase